MEREKIAEVIRSGKAVLGMEFGSTRIKAVLVDPEGNPIASGSHGWENRLENQIWTYSLKDIREGLQDCYAGLKQDVKEKYGETLTQLAAMGFSGMMHGYMAFDKDNESFKKRIGIDRAASSYKVRVRSRNHLAAFIKKCYKRSDISMLELTPDFIKEYEIYLSTDAGLHNGSVWSHCMWLKTIVSKAHYNGLTPRNPFAQYRVNQNIKERQYLTEDEIKAVMTHEFADKKLAYIRDLFVFASFTALSFVDIKELTTDDIVEINGEKWILSKRHKTKVNFQVKLLDIPLQIIKRYERFQEDKLVFPNLNYWNICKPLKKMIKECDISKDISFHCTRHGFATLALSKGVPIESVSRVLGHTNITTTQKYAKITTEKIDKDLTMFGNRLNQSFSEISIAM